MASQPLLIPYSRSPWFWLLQTFPADQRELATAVLRVQWGDIKVAAGHNRQALIATAHQYVRQAAKNPDSIRWAENVRGRRHTEKGDRWKSDLERLAKELF